MPRLTGVLDATVIIGLAKGGVFHHLAALYRPLYVPRAVAAEVIGHGQGRTGAAELAQALGVWITEVVPDPPTLLPFGGLRSFADREVLAVAHDLSRSVDHILSDDDHLLRYRTTLQLVCLRTTDVVGLLKRQGLIAEVKPVLH